MITCNVLTGESVSCRWARSRSAPRLRCRVDDGDGSARLGERPSGGGSNVSGGAGHEGDLPGEIVGDHVQVLGLRKRRVSLVRSCYFPL